MPRGRKPKPAHLRLIQGNPGHRPIPPEIQPERPPEVPEPPDDLGADGKAEWRRVAPELYHLQLLTRIDLRCFAAYCQAYDRWITAERVLAHMAGRDEVGFGLMIRTVSGEAKENPLVRTSREAAAAMVRYAAEFGLTPVSRARLAAGTFQTAVSKFEGLIGRQARPGPR
jgi:P27 family predicted phage terminase small subunit